MKGWWKKAENGYNFTLFELDDSWGVTSYSYAARNEEVKSIGLSWTVPTNENNRDNSS
jgi:hypothetical protein